MESVTCPHCSKTFYNVYAKNRHIRKVHLLEVENTNQKKNHVFCPLCSDGVKRSFALYSLLIQHITDVHNIIVKQENLSFLNKETFESWMALEKRNVNYVNERSLNRFDKKIVYYNCNRSNSHGLQSTATKRIVKKCGSIKINGVCPSRIIAHFNKHNGQVTVNFVQTHVGHTSTSENLEKLDSVDEPQEENVSEEMYKKITEQRILSLLRDIPNVEVYKDIIRKIIPIIKSGSEGSSKEMERKMEKQTYFPEQKKPRRHQ